MTDAAPEPKVKERVKGHPLREFRSRFKPWLGFARRTLVSTSIILLITLLLFLVVEGAASVVVAARSPAESMPPERSHTEFDPELGWINRPKVRLDDLYGPGRYLETNSQRFRSRRDFDRVLPRDKVRVLCTGDSFTLGYGVSNDDAWCELLTRKDERLETINMGQGGYGVDQAYLWYRRDGQALNHDALIFAFTAGDFLRMMRASFMGYPKPVLAIDAGKPVVARRSSRLGYIARGVGQRMPQLRRLRFVELWQGDRSSPGNTDPQVMSSDDGRRLVLSMMEDLKTFHTQNNTNLIVVLLPILEDYRGTGADEWQRFLHDELSKRQIPFLDLVQVMRKEPEGSVPLLFRGHYNELGNRWVADRLYHELLDLPRVRERLRQIGPPHRPVTALAQMSSLASTEAIPLQGVRIRAHPMNDLAQQTLDGSLSTRWHSGEFQTGNEHVVIDLGTPVWVHSLKLRLGNAGYDYGRILAIDVADDESRYTEVLRVDGDQVTFRDVDGSTEQRLGLREPVRTRFIRIRQLGHSDENFWSLAEIELYAAAK